MARLTVAADEASLAAAAADRVAALTRQAIARAGAALIALAGGGSPRRLYRLLGDPASDWSRSVEWERVHVFWGDERVVPPDDPQSNFGMARDALLRHVAIPAAQVHRFHGEWPSAADAAEAYNREIEDAFAAADRADRSFDVTLLGIGEDAHIASIFPQSPLLDVSDRASAASPPAAAASPGRAAAVWVPHLEAWRLTLTPATLLESRRVLVLASGERKRSAIRAALYGPENVTRWPAQLLRRAGDRVEWLMDRAADPGEDTQADTTEESG